ncbi:nucleic acid/nucleotide deaminase domain-containing protein [Kitasatospora sp. NPDC001175]|uniref:nucleic acid/nucleotide deaminase domain-containing protein n=1 Tax=Kitasatospora sp. NPDC001175 TaxID=3157103 RepID=UPI003CFD928A
MTNQVTKALEHGAEKLGKTLADDAGKAVKDFYHSTGDNLKKVAHNTREADAKHAGDLKRMLDSEPKNGPRAPHEPAGPSGSRGGGGGDGGGRKKYFVHDDGRVQEIRGGKLVDLDPKDKSGVHTLLDSSSGKVKDPSAKDMEKKYHAQKDPKKPGEKVHSDKIDDPTELSRAVEEARRGESDYKGKNYAALRYKDKDGEFIVVGRSGDLRSHSERSIGKPLLGGKEQNVKELYTERAPCQKNANCERWLARHFEPHNSDLSVSHGVEYNNSIPQKDRDWAHRAYVKQLKDDHDAGNYGGTMGKHDFDDQGAKDKAAADARRAERPAKRARKGQ